MLDAPLCREFRSETDAGSEIIQIKAKMKVGWKSLNSQRQAENFSKKTIVFEKRLFSDFVSPRREDPRLAILLKPDSRKVNPALGR